MSDVYLTNSLTRRKEKFEPIKPPNVGMYTCGPTVYWSTHIGHMSKYVGDDILRRVLTFNGYKIKHVMNITDVGHLVSDADEGEDKLEVGAKREGVSVWDVAKKYEKEFFETMDAINVLRPDVVARATEHIAEQINLIKRLVEKEYAYETSAALYFEVDKFPDYWKLSGQKPEEQKVGAREEVVIDPEKKRPYDFALWFKRVGRFANHTMHWNSPWGDGFPGWHIECSAMSMKYLGETFDIHTGGIDHLGVHHPAEIAQSECATGRPFVRYWIHRVFILIDGEKMSKSKANFFTLDDLAKRGYEPLSLRYLFLTAHYREPLNFTWESLGSAQNALDKLREQVVVLKEEKERTQLSPEKREKVEEYRGQFLGAVNDDLNTAKALAVVWEMLKSNIPSNDKYDLVLYFDEILGLGLAEASSLKLDIPVEVKRLVEEREKLRKEGKWQEADKLRIKIEKFGFKVEDIADGPKIKAAR